MDSDQEGSSMENGDMPFGPKDISLDVKLAFGRVCALIDVLEDSEENRQLFHDIQREAKMLLKKRNNTSDNSQLHQTHYPFHPAAFSRPLNNESMRDNQNNSFFGERRNNKVLHTTLTSEQKSFRPIKNQSFHNVQLGTIPESEERGKPLQEIEDIDSSTSSLSSLSIPETNEEEPTFILKKWSVKRDNNNLRLTGIKLSRKGNVLDKNFVTERVISRPENDLIRTYDGTFILQEPISDPNNSIPKEVKANFEKESYFPKHWRKVVKMWTEIEESANNNKKKTPKETKSTVQARTKKRPSNSENDTQNKISKKNTPKEGPTPVSSKKDASASTKKDTPLNSKKDTPLNSKKDTSVNSKKATAKEAGPAEKKKPTPKQPKKTPQDENKKTVPKKKPPKETDGKTKAAQKRKSLDPVKPKAVKSKDKNKSITEKKSTKLTATKHPENLTSAGERDPWEDAMAITELDDDPLFHLPQTSLTPTGLMGSIKKHTIKGRYTPPTDMFDNVYGPTTTLCTSSNNSSLNVVFSKKCNKNSNVVKRLAKAKGAARVQKIKEAGKYTKRIEGEEDSELIGEVIRAAQLKTTTTPPILKEIFRNDSNITDGSDFDSDG